MKRPDINMTNHLFFKQWVSSFRQNTAFEIKFDVRLVSIEIYRISQGSRLQSMILRHIEYLSGVS